MNASQAAFSDYLIPFSFESEVKIGFILRKGTEEGLNAFKTACKKNGVTVGAGLVAAIQWTFAKFNSSRDSVCFIDVNLRGRLGGPDLNKEERH